MTTLYPLFVKTGLSTLLYFVSVPYLMMADVGNRKCSSIKQTKYIRSTLCSLDNKNKQLIGKCTTALCYLRSC